MRVLATTTCMAAQDQALLELLGELEGRGYDFVTPTPATHRRVLDRAAEATPGDVRDIFGWSRAFRREDAPVLADLLDAAGQLEPRNDGRVASRVRVSRVSGSLFLHSAFPTDAEDAVFLGPDSYRFAEVIRRELPPSLAGRIVDVGGGAGVGAILAALWAPGAAVEMTDVNRLALRFARVNARHAGVPLKIRETSGLEGVAPGVDLVVANPPYMAASTQTYRDGGGELGGGLSRDWAEAALDRLASGGRMILYTGSAIGPGGADLLHQALSDLARRRDADLDYHELDPDVFGEELATDAYRNVERIAVVLASFTVA